MNSDDLVYEYLETAEVCLEIAVRELEVRAKNHSLDSGTVKLLKVVKNSIPFIKDTRISFFEELRDELEYEEETEEFSRRINGGSVCL